MVGMDEIPPCTTLLRQNHILCAITAHKSTSFGSHLSIIDKNRWEKFSLFIKLPYHSLICLVLNDTTMRYAQHIRFPLHILDKLYLLPSSGDKDYLLLGRCFGKPTKWTSWHYLELWDSIPSSIKIQSLCYRCPCPYSGTEPEVLMGRSQWPKFFFG